MGKIWIFLESPPILQATAYTSFIYLNMNKETKRKGAVYMKILLATYWIVPHVGGVWNYMNQLKKRLEVLGHEVDLLGYGELHKYTYFVSEEKRFLMMIYK